MKIRTCRDGREQRERSDRAEPPHPSLSPAGDLRPHRLIGVVSLEDLLCFLLSAVGEEHDDLITVGPRNILLCVCAGGGEINMWWR